MSDQNTTPRDLDPEAYEGPNAIISTIAVANLVNKKRYPSLGENATGQVAAWFTQLPDDDRDLGIVTAAAHATSFIFAERYPWAKDLDDLYPTVESEDAATFVEWRKTTEAEIEALQQFVDKHGDYCMIEPASEDDLRRMSDHIQEMKRVRDEQEELIKSMLRNMTGN